MPNGTTIFCKQKWLYTIASYLLSVLAIFLIRRSVVRKEKLNKVIREPWIIGLITGTLVTTIRLIDFVSYRISTYTIVDRLIGNILNSLYGGSVFLVQFLALLISSTLLGLVIGALITYLVKKFKKRS